VAAVTGAYAGHPEFVALSAVFRVTMHVWGADDTTVISSSADPDLPTLHLAHRNAGNFLDHHWAAVSHMSMVDLSHAHRQITLQVCHRSPQLRHHCRMNSFA
jgi:hypothetical protein